MLRLGFLFLIVALIAGLFGFGVISAESWAIAKIFFFIFIVLAVFSLISGVFSGREPV